MLKLLNLRCLSVIISQKPGAHKLWAPAETKRKTGNVVDPEMEMT